MSSFKTEEIILKKQEIHSLDLSLITKKLIEKHGWSVDEACECEKLYKNFLFLSLKYWGKNVLIPTDEIDIYWHEHILDTKKYMKDCDNIFNEYFHHCPYIGSNQSDINSEKAKDLFNETQTLFYKKY